MVLLRVNRNHVFISSALVLASATLVFGSLPYFDSGFMYYAMLGRLMQGIAVAGIEVCSFSIVSSLYGKNAEKYIGYNLGALAIGYITSPIIGGILYKNFGFSLMFYIFFTINTVIIYLLHVSLKGIN
mmetsp:Transcript_3817/g.512  ORF Transcript_3817/g.512 Transcript_3817/m.512 type:complete len:128 (-) Transcript_3817:344-727(-)